MGRLVANIYAKSIDTHDPAGPSNMTERRLDISTSIKYDVFPKKGREISTFTLILFAKIICPLTLYKFSTSDSETSTLSLAEIHPDDESLHNRSI